MPHFEYRRHFAALAAGVLILLPLSHWDLLKDALLPEFALNGAIHAVTLVLALRAPQPLVRKCLFIALAAALSMGTLYVGILALQLMAPLPAGQRLYTVLGICAIAGAITYGALVRLYWIKDLSSRSILAIATVCAAATLLAFSVRSLLPFFGAFWLTAAWWFAFSTALWRLDTRPS